MKGGKEENQLRGLVLSGGESRRMGRDKGLISQNSLLWVNRAGMLLQSVDLPVSIMIREPQRCEYTAAILPDFELLNDLDLPVGGPLKGLLSFYFLYPQNDVLVLPCDMPNLTSALLTELIEIYAEKPEFEAWVFENQEVLQPFPGIYSSRLLSSVFEKAKSNKLTRHGLSHLLNTAKTARKGIEDEFALQNLNSPT